MQQDVLPCAVSKLDHVLHKEAHTLMFAEYVCKADFYDAKL